eukprot:7886117-Alexandrium_andersonii.AAC.1
MATRALTLDQPSPSPHPACPLSQPQAPIAQRSQALPADDPDPAQGGAERCPQGGAQGHWHAP